MRSLLSCLLLCSLFLACGKAEEENEGPKPQYAPLGANDVSKLTSTELRRSQRVCAAITSKRLMIINDLVGKTKQFSLRQSKGDCFNNIEDLGGVRAYVESPVVINETIAFKSLGSNQSVGPLGDVVTDKNELLAEFCNSVITDDLPLNIVKGEGFTYRYIFPENQDGVIEIITYMQRDDGEFYPARADRFVVNLSKGEDKGFLISRSTGAFCANDRSIISFYRQDTDFL